MVAAATQRLLVLDFGRLIADGPIDRACSRTPVSAAPTSGTRRAAPGAVADRAGPVARAASGPAAPHGRRPGRFSSCTTSTSPTARTGRCSASRSRSPSARRSRSSGRTGPASRRSPAWSRGSCAPSAGRIVFDGARRHRVARLADRPPRGRPRPRGSFGVRRRSPSRRISRSTSAAPLAPGASPTALRRAYETYPRLGERRDQLAGHALRWRAAHARAGEGARRAPAAARRRRAVARPRAGVVVDEVFAALRAVLAAGTALLIVEQHVERALELADRAVVLSEGRATFEGHITDVRDVASPMLGPLRDLLGP